MNRATFFGLFGLSLAGCSVAHSLVEEHREPPDAPLRGSCQAIPQCSSPPLPELTPGADATFPQNGPAEYRCAVDPGRCQAGDTKDLQKDGATAQEKAFVVPAGEALVLRGVQLTDVRISLEDEASLEINGSLLTGVVITTQNPTDAARLKLYDSHLVQVRVDAPRSHLHVLRDALAQTTLHVQDLFVQNTEAHSLAVNARFLQTSGSAFKATVFDADELALSASLLDNARVTSCATLTMIAGTTKQTQFAACSREPARFFRSRVTTTDFLGSVETLSTTAYFVRFFGESEQDSTFWGGIVTHSAFCASTRGLFAKNQGVSCIACDGNERYVAESCTETPPRGQTGPCEPFHSIEQCEGEFQPEPVTWLPE